MTAPETSELLKNLREDFRDLKQELSGLRAELHENLISVAVLETRVKDVARNISTWTAIIVSLITSVLSAVIAKVFF